MILPHDPQIAAWLADGPHEGPPESLARALAATHRTRKRPRWTFPERWIPMQLTMNRTRSQRPMLAIVMLVLLLVALIAAALVIGSQLREPPPVGPARNGAVVYERDGDLFIADELGGTPRSLTTGRETDTKPVFSPQGDRVAFIRDGARIVTVSLDGLDVRELANPGTVVRLDWSPDGRALLASTFSAEDLQALTVVQSDGSGSRTLDLNGIYTVSGTWRPNGRQIAFVGYQGGTLATFIADADGTNVRPLGVAPVGPGDASHGLEWSPDGKHLGLLSPTEARRTITIVDIAEDGAVTEVRPLNLDVESLIRREAPQLRNPESTLTTDPKWSPDSSQLAFALRTSFIPDDRTRLIGTPHGSGFNTTSRVAIADADGSNLRLVGPADGVTNFAWSPDGRSLFMASAPEGRPMEAWSVDVATGEQIKVGTPVESWQRLAP